MALRLLPRWTSRSRGEPVEDRALAQAAVPSPPSLLAAAPGSPALTAEAALRIGDVWACVRVLADAAASVPLIAYRHTDAGLSLIHI